MIISDAEGRRAALAGPKWLAGLFLLVCCLLLWWSHRSATSASNIAPPRSEQVFCDAEQRDGTVFVNGPFQFSAGEKQTAEQAHSGQFSCKVDSGVGLQFGFSHQLQGYQPGDRFRASVWRHRLDERRGSYLVASAEGEGKFYLTANLGSKEDKGWEKLQLYFQLPLLKAVDNLKVYVYTDGKSPVYFDDLQIEKVGNLKDSLQQPLEVLQLQLGEKAMQKLATKRQEALREGILERADGDWVKGKLSSERQEEAQPVSVRLKGDWLDHLMGKKWSFRVKMKGGQSWNRLRLFSLHSPKARAHLMEWILHRLFEKEDVLTTRYDFVQLALNEDHLGVYAIEEHFDKVLLEYKHRREGPIVKFTEEGFWAGLKRSMRQFDAVDHELNQTVVEMENADIRPFNEKQTLANPRLAEAFEAAQKALQQYRYGLKTTAELFDLDLLARFYALCDLMGAYHGLAWHNQRFYFNPVTQLLEPIGYDGFGSHVPIRTTILGQGALNPRKIQEERLDNKLFQDKDFTAKYIQYLYRYSSYEYVKEFMASIESELRARELLLQEEFEEYAFDRRDFFRNTQRVHSLLLPFDELSLRAYTQQQDGTIKELRLANTHGLPLEVVGVGSRQDRMSDSLEVPVLLEGFHPRLFKSLIEQNRRNQILLDTFTPAMSWRAFHQQEFLQFGELRVRPSARYLFYRPLGLDTVFRTAISPWKAPLGELAAQEIFDQYPLQSTHPIYRRSAGQVFFPKGKHILSEPICIPKGQRVIFEAGCEIDIRKGGMIVSRSPVFMYGTEEEVVILRSSDHKGMGLSVIQAATESKINYAIFDHLDRLQYKEWELTGAVTFYESDVSINHSVFKNNPCEDGLNLIRSEFSLNNSRISNTLSDGLDADFCKGYIGHSSFVNTGNDGLDVSGSVILIDNSLAENCGDKGVSIGEESDATIFDITIKGAKIGMASKDLSVLSVRQVHLEDCQQGFAAYRKKPEYGGAQIIVQSYTRKNVKRLYNIRKGSRLQLEKKLIVGQE